MHPLPSPHMDPTGLCDQVYDELDLDRDGRVGYSDFLAMMRMAVPS